MQVTSSLSLPHTACSRSLKATPRPVRSCITARSQDLRRACCSTVTTRSRCVEAAARISALALNAEDLISWCFPQANEGVQVEGEVASILSQTRFKEEFTFQPQGGPSPSCGGKPKVSVSAKNSWMWKRLCRIFLRALGVSVFVLSVSSV